VRQQPVEARQAAIPPARICSYVPLLAVAGVLMLVNNPWWPAGALVACGVYLDAAGREAAQCLSLHAAGVRIGSPVDLNFGPAVTSTGMLPVSRRPVSRQLA